MMININGLGELEDVVLGDGLTLVLAVHIQGFVKALHLYMYCCC